MDKSTSFWRYLITYRSVWLASASDFFGTPLPIGSVLSVPAHTGGAQRTVLGPLPLAVVPASGGEGAARLKVVGAAVAHSCAAFSARRSSCRAVRTAGWAALMRERRLVTAA